MPYLYVLLLSWFLFSGCQNAYDHIQQTWIMEKIVYKEGIPPYILTANSSILHFDKDSLHYHNVIYQQPLVNAAYKLVGQEDGRADSLIWWEGDSATQLIVQAYKDSLLIYPNEELEFYYVYTPLKRFKQQAEQDHYQQSLSNQYYQLEMPALDSNLTVKFTAEGELLVKQWLEQENRKVKHWQLASYEEELFLIWKLARHDYLTFQLVSLHQDSILAWNYQQQAYVKFKRQSTPTIEASKKPLIGYWKQKPAIDTRPLPPPPPLPYPKANVLRWSITTDSFRAVFLEEDHTAPWSISPSGNYCLLPNSWDKRKYPSPILGKVEEISDSLLKIELPLLYNAYNQWKYREVLSFVRMTEEEFIGSLPE